jgi:hypothetical protein
LLIGFNCVVYVRRYSDFPASPYELHQSYVALITSKFARALAKRVLWPRAGLSQSQVLPGACPEWERFTLC